MKKYFFMSAIAATMLCACTNDSDEVMSVGASQNGENGLMPIELSVKTPVKIITRGTGTVGDLTANAENNVWRGETLYFNMFMKKNLAEESVLELSTWQKIEGESEPVDVVNFDNVPLSVTSDGISEVANVVWADSKYYPQDKTRHDFFAYRIDDAATELVDGKPVLNDELDADGEVKLQKSVKFQINGTQDLMVGQADPAASETSYSANSARAGVKPRIDMKHLLSRFTFEVVAGDITADGLVVKKIEVVSKKSGKMIVAWNPEQAPGAAENMIIWDESADNKDVFTLMQRPNVAGELQYNTQLEEMSPATLAWDATDGATQVTQTVGEALMVSPGQEKYDIFITTDQTLVGGEVNTTRYQSEINVASTNGGPAIAGTSYKVKVTLYGQSKIELTTSLTGWNSGTDIPVDTAN